MDTVEMKERMDDHEGRIKTLETAYSNFVGEITSVKNGQLQLENTVLKTSQDQNGLLNTLINNTFDLKKTKMLTRKEIIIASISGGSIFGVAVGLVIKFM